MDSVLQELERFECLSQELEDLERESNETKRIQEALYDAKDIVDGLEKTAKSSFRKENDTWFLLPNGTFIRLDNKKAPASLRTELLAREKKLETLKEKRGTLYEEWSKEKVVSERAISKLASKGGMDSKAE